VLCAVCVLCVCLGVLGVLLVLGVVVLRVVFLLLPPPFGHMGLDSRYKKMYCVAVHAVHSDCFYLFLGMLQQHMDDSDEFTSELSIDGEPIPVTTFLDPSFEWPREGTMSIVYTYFSDREPMSASNYAAIIQEVRQGLFLECQPALCLCLQGCWLCAYV
jgi:hypothetical protein